MSFPFTLVECREAERAARRRLGVPGPRDAALLALAGAARPSAVARFALAARLAARGLERLAARIERLAGAGASRVVAPAARR